MVVVIILIIIAAIVIISFICYRMAFYQSNADKKRIPEFPDNDQYSPYKEMGRKLKDELMKMPYEEVVIRSRDNTELYGRYYHNFEAAPIDIMFHGYRSTACRDFCGGFKLSREAGHNILLVDQRAHGRSGGHTLTFGIKEKYDCLCWAEYAARRFLGSDIYLYGVSMGASTVLSASELPLPPNVKGILADSPFSSPREIISKVCWDMKIPAGLAFPFVALGGLIFGHINAFDKGAKEAVKNAKVPILIIHGVADRFVPHSMSEEIFGNIKGKKKMLSVPEAGHAISYFVNSEEYKKAITEFLEE